VACGVGALLSTTPKVVAFWGHGKRANASPVKVSMLIIFFVWVFMVLVLLPTRIVIPENGGVGGFHRLWTMAMQFAEAVDNGNYHARTKG
jgi:hypothetical protein